MPTKRPLEASVVLVVEDYDFVRSNAVDMLEDAGFTVVAARHADEAWDILHRRSDIGVLFTDVDMPGTMCGVTIADAGQRELAAHPAGSDFGTASVHGRGGPGPRVVRAQAI